MGKYKGIMEKVAENWEKGGSGNLGKFGESFQSLKNWNEFDGFVVHNLLISLLHEKLFISFPMSYEKM